MAINYQMPTFEESNPGYVGAQKVGSLNAQMAALKAQQLANQNQKMANQYQQPTLEEALKQQQLDNQIKAVAAQYAQPKTAADIASTQAKTQWLPYEALGKYASGLGSYQNAQYNSSGLPALVRSLSTPQVESLYQQNPQFASNVANSLADLSGKVAGGGGGMSMRAPVSNLPTPSQLFSGGGQMQPQMQGPNAAQMALQQQQGNPRRASIFSPQDIAASQSATGQVLTKRENTANILNQQQYAQNLDALFAQSDPLMPSVVKFAGLAGKSKGGYEAAKAALGGETSQDYQNYNKFVTVDVPYEAGEISRSLGKNATDMEQELLMELAKPTTWNNNPQLALSKWNRLKLMASTTGKSLATPNTTVRSNLASGGEANKPTYTQADLEHTAKKHGISVDEVKRRLGAQ